MEAFSVWSQFFACAAAIGVAGAKLSRYGDVIADKTGLSGGWIGLALLATVTSLPELATGVSAVLAGLPNIAVGDALGSTVFNLVLLALVDLLARGESFYRRAATGHILSAGFGVVLLGFVAINVVLAQAGPLPAIGHVGIYAPIIVALYLLAMRTVFAYEARQRREFAQAVADRYPSVTLRAAVARYVAAAAVVVAAGIWLPLVGDRLATLMGWHKTFVGTMLVAGATSLPELAVTVAALRLGALDMAIGNVLGSNLFDVVVLAIDDVFYAPGPLLAHVAPVHAVTALSALVMSGIVVIGIVDRPNVRLVRTVGWLSLALFAVYLLNMLAHFVYGG